MIKHSIRGIVEPDIKFSLVESSEVDGEHILGKVRGQFFVPDGTSRNGRFYPKALWEKVLGKQSIISKIEKRLMFGTIGHDGSITDEGLRNGNASHVMTKVEIDSNNKGMGEALILNTPTGRILNTMLRAGCMLSTSSRANGTFKGKKNGLPIVDENTYDLDGWDFVVDPGFLEANPSIAEAFKILNNNEGENNMENKNNSNTKGITMDERLVKHITDENADLKKQVSDLMDENEAIKEDKKVIDDENLSLKETNEKLVEANKIVESFKELGSIDEVKENLKKGKEAIETVAKYEELADSPEEASKAFDIAESNMAEIAENFGSVEDIKKVFEAHTSLVEEIAEIGTMESIKDCLSGYEEILDEKEANEKEAKHKELAEELGLSVEKVSTLLEKYSAEEVKDLHATISESAPKTDKYKKTNFNENKESDDKASDDLYESSIMGKSRIDRINERLNK